MKSIFYTIIFLIIVTPAFAQATKETLYLKDQISRLEGEVSEQKNLIKGLTDEISMLTENQTILITNIKETNKFILGLPGSSELKNSQNKFKDAFLLNKNGKPVAFVDAGLKLYEYYGGNLIGWINLDTNEIVRNHDNSVVAVIDGDFILDETGHTIGSIERSENLRWDREKLYSQIQKKPVSQYFVRLENPKQFNLSTFRFSDWSDQMLEDVLLFSEKKIQKLK